MHEPWEIEISFYIDQRGIDPERARTFTILRWMWFCDLRPLEAAIVEGRTLDQGVLNLLADMIADGRLQARPLKRGRPKKPETFARSIASVVMYDADEDGTSDEIFDRIAKALRTTDRTVRQDVTAWRKVQQSTK